MSKKYVQVTAVFNEEGEIKPVNIHWEDGRNFEIDRITDISRATTMRSGGQGMRYTCMIMGRKSYLYYENDGRWFVDSK